MDKLLRFYNQNRRTIWLVIFGIVLFLLIIFALNNISKQENQNKKEQYQEIYKTITSSEYKTNPDIKVNITNEEVKDNYNLVIDQFIRYCNAGQIESAYALLSNKCKEYLYPTIDSFKQDYINNIFSATKLYEKTNYKGQTYKIRLYNDIAATGLIEMEAYEEYYTIVKENDGTTKLNINNYIGEEVINKSASNKNLEVTVLSVNVYKDYQEYTLEVKNLTDKEIMLDSFESSKSIYINGSGSLKFYSMLHENTNQDLTIKPSLKKKIRIKFNVGYNYNNDVYEMVISDIILDNELYENSKNKKDFKNRGKIIVEF